MRRDQLLILILVAIAAATAGYLIGVRQPKGGTIGTVQLTAQECTSLGGTVNASSKTCFDKGQFTCQTTDNRGETHQACIDEVAQQ